MLLALLLSSISLHVSPYKWSQLFRNLRGPAMLPHNDIARPASFDHQLCTATSIIVRRCHVTSLVVFCSTGATPVVFHRPPAVSYEHGRTGLCVVKRLCAGPLRNDGEEYHTPHVVCHTIAPPASSDKPRSGHATGLFASGWPSRTGISTTW